MATGLISFFTCDVRGLNDSIKRALIFHYLHQQNCDLQETHMLPEKLPLLNHPWLGWSYYSTFTNMAWGVSIFIHHRIPFQLASMMLDRDSRFIILNCLIFQKHFLIIGVYIPPPNSSTVIREILDYVASYPHIPCVWLGDFNCLWDRSLIHLILWTFRFTLHILISVTSFSGSVDA